MPRLDTMRSHILRTGGVSVIAALALVACGSNGDNGDGTPEGGAGETEAVGGTLNVAVDSEAECIDPWQADNPAIMTAIRGINESLTWIDPETGELLPWLAESWEVNDDATEFTFTLQEGVTFSDGTEVTAEVLQQNYDTAVDYTQSARLPSYLAGYSGTDIVDDLTFTINFEESNASFLNRTASQFMTVLAPATLEMSAEERCSDFISTGPFVLDRFQINQEIAITAREDYDWAQDWAGHTGRANLDEIVFSIVPESSSRIGLLTSNQADIIQNIEIQDFDAAEGAGATIVTTTIPGIPIRVQYNTAETPFDEEEVRLALNYYMDRDELNEVVFGGNNTPATSLLIPAVPGSLDLADEVFRHDPEAGDELLESAGWERNEDDMWERDGEVLSVHAITAAPYSTTPPMLELFGQQLAANGVDFSFEPQTGDFVEFATNHRYEVLISNTTDMDGDVLRGQLSPVFGNRANLPEDHPLTDLTSEQNTIGDPELRAEALGDVQRLIAEEGLQIPMMPVIQEFAIAEQVEGYTVDVESRLYLYGASLSD